MLNGAPWNSKTRLVFSGCYRIFPEVSASHRSRQKGSVSQASPSFPSPEAPYRVHLAQVPAEVNHHMMCRLVPTSISDISISVQAFLRVHVRAKVQYSCQKSIHSSVAPPYTVTITLHHS